MDGLDGDTKDGTFHDLRNERVSGIDMLNSSGTLVTSVSQAASFVVKHRNGGKETYQKIDLDPDPNAASNGLHG